jgi:hypothetical protein
MPSMLHCSDLKRRYKFFDQDPLKATTEARDILQKLVSSRPNEISFRSALLSVDIRIGELLEKANDLPAALTH